MNYQAIFSELLQTSTEQVSWAIQQMPRDMYYSVSPRHPDSWSVARIILHLQFQEERVVLPNMRLWLPERSAYAEQDDALIEHYKEFAALVHDEEETWKSKPDVGSVLARFQENRKKQSALVNIFPDNVWEEEKQTVWGTVTLRWAITKTYQHTVEHINDILKPALYWTGLSHSKR
jgi:hypothetical protein